MQNIETTSVSENQGMEGGFADPVFDAQFVFDKVMNAMARPGSIVNLAPLACAPEPLFATTAAILATLCDNDASVWMDLPEAKMRPAGDWLSFHTGAKLESTKQHAQFGVICDAAAMPSLAEFSKGSQEYPDRSATLILQLGAIETGDELVLTGPGIKTQTKIAVGGLPEDFLFQWEVNHAGFPLGVDVILVSGEALVCLPRTVQISRFVVEEWR